MWQRMAWLFRIRDLREEEEPTHPYCKGNYGPGRARASDKLNSIPHPRLQFPHAPLSCHNLLILKTIVIKKLVQVTPVPHGMSVTRFCSNMVGELGETLVQHSILKDGFTLTLFEN